MREADLPSPGIVQNSQQLRRLAATTLGQLEAVAVKSPSGLTSAAQLRAFFLACSNSIAAGSFSATALAARKFLASYNAASTPALLDVAPTFSVGAANDPSTLRTASTVLQNGGQYNVDNPLIEVVAGAFGLNGGTKFVGQGMSNGTSTLRGTYGQTFRFRTNSPSFDLAYQEGVVASQTNVGIAGYVTDPVTGVRKRMRADDFASNDNAAMRYIRWDFGSVQDRIIELTLTPSALIRSLNLSPTYSLIALPALPVKPKVLFVWDSYGEATISQGAMTTDAVKKGILPQIAERFGIPFPQMAPRGGTGFLNPGGSNGTYGTRRSFGDVTRYGQVDLFMALGSLNDDVGINAAYTDSALSTAMTAYFTGAASDQPSALIVGSGPEASTTRPANQTRWNIMKAAFLAVAAADPTPARFVWLDGSPSGDNWYNGITSGPDNTHLTRADTDIVAGRMTTTLYNALTALAA